MPMPAFSRMRWRTTIPKFFIFLVLLISTVFSIGTHHLALAASSASLVHGCKWSTQ